MDSEFKKIEFEQVVDSEGKIILPATAQAEFPPGERLRVRLTSPALSKALRERRVTEEEIEGIANLQMESREQVVKFLLSEGALGPVRVVRRGKKG